MTEQKKSRRLEVTISSISNLRTPNFTDGGKYLALAVAISNKDHSHKREIIRWKDKLLLDKSGSCLGLDNCNFIFEKCLSEEGQLVMDIAILRRIPKLDIEEVCCSCRINIDRYNSSSREFWYKLIESEDQQRNAVALFGYQNGSYTSSEANNHEVGDVKLTYEVLDASRSKNSHWISRISVALLAIFFLSIVVLASNLLFLDDTDQYEWLFERISIPRNEVKVALLGAKDQLKKHLTIIENTPHLTQEQELDTQFGLIESRVDMGLKLLAHGDQSGAEAACSFAMRFVTNHKRARICVGEARLALYVQALSFGSLGIYDDKLDMALEDFRILIDDDPSNPTVRSGLGLAFLLKAMTTSVSLDDRSRFLFESSLHFSAASRQVDNEKGHLSSLWNSAIAQIQLSRPDVASELFRKVAQHNKNLISMSNLGIALLAVGDTGEAVHVFKEALSLFCELEKRHEKNYEEVMLCSSIHNSLGVSYEITDAACSRESKSYQQQALLEYEYSMQWNPLHKEVKQNHGKLLAILAEKMERTIDVVTEESIEGSLSSLKLAISAFERALEQTPSNSRLWIGLARARVHSDEYEEALNASIKAVDCAVGKDEVDVATKMLEEALERTVTSKDSIVSSEKTSSMDPSDNLSSDMKSLRLELELQNLKLQLLQQTLQGNTKSSDSIEADEITRESEEHKRSKIFNMKNTRINDKNSVKLDSSDGGNSDSSEVKVNNTNTLSETSRNHSDSESNNRNTMGDNEISNETEKKIPSVDPINDSFNEASSGSTNIHPRNNVNETIPKDFESNNSYINIPNAKQIIQNNNSISGTESGDPDYIDLDDPVAGFDNAIKNSDLNIGLKDPPKKKVGESIIANRSSSESDTMALFEPEIEILQDVPDVAKSYMKLAEAHVSQGNFKKAITQYRRVLDKSPNYLPARLGLAKSLENVKSTKTAEIVEAYNQAARTAVVLGESGAFVGQRGEGGKAEELLRLGIKRALAAKRDIIPILKSLLSHAHTPLLAADINYEIGLQYLRDVDDDSSIPNASLSFIRATTMAKKYNSTEKEIVHGESLIELGKIALQTDKNASEAELYFKEALKGEWEDDGASVEFLLGQAQEASKNITGAIGTYNDALKKSGITLTGEIHHQIAVLLSKESKDIYASDVIFHFEKALESGMDPTPEAIESLGEDNDFIKIARLIKERSTKQAEQDITATSTKNSIKMNKRNTI